jgi:type III secretory pathway component EscS
MQAILVDGLLLALLLSLVPMAAIAFGAGLVALFQAVTQIQEQSLTHLVRLVVLAAVLAWGGYSAFGEVERLLVRSIVAVGASQLR